MTVGLMFSDEKLEREFIEHNFDGAYWESCDKFVAENWHREVETLSAKQNVWFQKILDDCIEKRIERQ